MADPNRSEPARDRIQLWVSLPQAPETVWAEIGGFDTIAQWHPEVASADLVTLEGDIHRHLRLADGSLFLERLAESGALYYSYELVDGPLPVAGHRATLSCVAEDGGCHVFWSAVFEPEDAVADQIVEGFFRAGLEALGERFGGERPAAARRAQKTR